MSARLKMALAATMASMIADQERAGVAALTGTPEVAPEPAPEKVKRKLTPAEVDILMKERRRRIQVARDAGDWREVRKLQGNPVTPIEESKIAAACQRRDRKGGRRLVAAAKGGIGKHEVRS
ncbi:hypothetical protein [Bosea sp. (in: a-proteobacteria)]|uniref:hypothetical protein n=1 Tax=Bosea sp. (in: a-proteobacteria) TaxID=1871050 RepID=UPI002734A938|nr:hypothetical protein [Bosea sp. (in: a-proteobacteria)]MDP3408091.1 hypothetical protein [Bosea sp. (in: a-proteobacteria)]